MRCFILAHFFLIFYSCQSQHPEKAAELRYPSVNPVAPVAHLSQKEKDYYAARIEPLYEKMLLRTGFNGEILMAKNGDVVFEDYHGTINFKTHEPITSNSVFHVASVSKTFTAMTVLRLMEQKKLDINDLVSKYLPGFPYPGVTIKHLLSHRSGLPEYLHFLDPTTVIVSRKKNKSGRWVTTRKVVRNVTDDQSFMTNEGLLQYLIEKHPPALPPGRAFNYCNTNFALLALIVEKVTQEPFPQYMKDSVFNRLGLKDTYIFSYHDVSNYIPSYSGSRPWMLEKPDLVYGDKNVYTNVRDLLAWDQALYNGSVVSQATLDMAYTPYSNEKRSKHNYGLGWHLLINPPNPEVVYHNGKYHGNNAVFLRLTSDMATLIILGNKYNGNIYKAKDLSSVFTNKIDTTELKN